eukprot:Partr_v1_DN27068_c0_g1_i2_m29105 putative dual-specificity tyrosine-(Y)-phosphorylation regulated kinase
MNSSLDSGAFNPHLPLAIRGKSFPMNSRRSADRQSFVQLGTRSANEGGPLTIRSHATLETTSQSQTGGMSMPSHSVIQQLSPIELREVNMFPDIYYYGQHCKGKLGTIEDYDDSRGDYQIIVGDQIAYRYEVLDLLGKGSFGQVAECYDHLKRQKVAIKIIRNKKRFHQQALVEVKILEHLRSVDTNDHFNIVKIESHFYFRNHLCITFPLLSMNLYEFIKFHNFIGFSLSLIRRIAVQITSCLSLLRRENIIHCDLKPENILLVHPKKSTIKVIDFGSSCFFDEKIYTYIQSRFYRSPEIVLGLPYGSAIDMWSVGCILAELYTGYPIFPAQDEQELIACVMEIFGPPPIDLLMKASRRKLFFHSNFTARQSANPKTRIRRVSSRPLEMVLKSPSGSNSANHAAFVDFIRRCLTWDPEFRLTPGQALEHPFVSIEVRFEYLRF